MAKDHLIDYPHFNPEEKVVFPPTGPATDDRDKWGKKPKKRYDETFDADTRAANPADTNPAVPDIREPFVDVEDKETMDTVSPAPTWRDDPREFVDTPDYE